MALPSAYLTSTKNLDGILSAIQTAQAPARFTVAFLENLGYKSSSDRLIINVLKSLGFLSGDGVPTERYYKYLDQIEAPGVLAEGLREAYADLFQLNRNAQEMSKSEVKNKFKTLTQGQASDDVLGKMANTFLELAKRGGWETRPPLESTPVSDAIREAGEELSRERPDSSSGGASAGNGRDPQGGGPLKFGGLHYNIAIHLPETRDQAVYDALFRSLREHLIG